MARPKKIKVRLNPLLEPRQGLHDPDTKRNPQVICKANYDDGDGMTIYETGFARARIDGGDLLEVKLKQPKPGDDLEGMTIPQLVEFAGAQQPPIDVNDCTKKADYIAKIREALKA